MTVCKFFLEGRCRFGQNCKFEHSYKDDFANKGTPSSQQLNVIIRQIVGEIIVAEKGGQWPLSCFAPLKEGSNIPGWEDISPEEIRWKMYEARRNGTLNQCINEVNQLYSEAEKRRNAMKQPTMDKISLIVNMLKGKKENSTSSNLFPSSPSSGSIFGGSTISDNSQNVFGAKASSSENIFGNSSQSSSSQGSIFGGNSNSYLNQNIFGGFNSQSNSFNQNIFSNPQNSVSNVFSSTPLVGSSTTTSNQNIFLNAQPSSPPNVTPFFSTPSVNIFSKEGTNTATFGSPKGFFQNTATTQNQGETSIFGGQKSENLFNNKSFSEKPKGFDFSQSDGNVTDNKSQFGASPGTIDSSVYSKKEELSEEENRAFTVPTFKFGKIPLKPPPLEYCK